ncbi:MAG: biotin--[acetyl-CoA-carboxylase] ligase [Elusimicrobiota bacterium]|nr:biotin--[acetyl-CoA-carboxylase] ligase [Elusimicrobiota bacterium]
MDTISLQEKKVSEILKAVFPSAAFKLLDECLSTQTAIRDEIRALPGRPYLVIARSQSDGAGRFGRKFHSPPGGLWFSFFVPSSLRLLDGNCAIEVASKIKDGLSLKLSVDVSTKEPNDIVTSDGRKLAGIIVTRIYSGSECAGAVIGAGINVNNDTDFDGVEAVSLSELTGGAVSIEAVLQVCLQSMASLVYDKEK